jgi:hypothetical protein
MRRGGEPKQVGQAAVCQQHQQPPHHLPLHVHLGIAAGVGRHPPVAAPLHFREQQHPARVQHVGTTTDHLRQEQHQFPLPSTTVPPAPHHTRTPSPHRHPRHGQHHQIAQQQQQAPQINQSQQHHPRKAGHGPSGASIATRNISLISILSRNDWTLALKKIEDDPESALRKESITLQGQVTVATPLHLAVVLGATVRPC